MDLVVGATGLVGGAAARRLKALGRDVRAGIRGGVAHPKAGGLADAGIQIVDADVTRPESLAGACRGVTTVIATANSIPSGQSRGLQTVDLEGMLALIDAAEKAGCQRFIYLSFSGGFDLESPLNHAKRTCEKRLAAGRMEAVILRPTVFMEIWLGPHLGFDARGGTVLIPGDGTEPIRYISARDVAEVAASAAAHPSPAGTWEMGGPEALPPREVVRIFERALGSSIAVTATPVSDLVAAYEAATDPLAKTFAALKLGYARGDAVPAAQASAAKFGVTPQSVADYAAEASR